MLRERDPRLSPQNDIATQPYGPELIRRMMATGNGFPVALCLPGTTPIFLLCATDTSTEESTDFIDQLEDRNVLELNLC